jgi:hypothetical protein
MVEESARTLYGAKKICFGEANSIDFKVIALCKEGETLPA